MTFQNNEIIPCDECKNSGCLIKFCHVDWLTLVNEKKTQTLFRKGQHIFLEGNPVFGIYFIQQGKVKVTASNFNGKKQIVRLAGDGHILGHRGYTGETYPIDSFTLEDSSICFFDNQTMYDAFMENPMFSFEMMMFYSKELRKSEQRNKVFAQMTVEEKIIFTLLYMASTFGLSTADKTINVTLSRQEIAEIAGTNAEQVSRTITVLNEKGFIKLIGKKILIMDAEGLKKKITRYGIGLL